MMCLMRDVQSNVSYNTIQIFSDLWKTIDIGEIAENITDVKDFESIEKSYLLLKSRLPRRWGFNLFLL
jgi:hypothetical protein